MEKIIKRFEPAVDKRLLIIFSGIVWSVIGTILCGLATIWLFNVVFEKFIWLTLTGIVLSLLISYLGFFRIVDLNIARILSKKDRVCIFAFQAWRSYLIAILMIGMGIALRSSPLPKPYLSVIYIGFGGAMILASLRYYRTFFRVIFDRQVLN
jgi:hypothetical protein